MSRRGNRKHPCNDCGTPTRSVSRRCIDHRAPDALPVVHVDGRIVSLAGLNLTTRQALRLADAIVDAAERIDSPSEEGRP